LFALVTNDIMMIYYAGWQHKLKTCSVAIEYKQTRETKSN